MDRDGLVRSDNGVALRASITEELTDYHRYFEESYRGIDRKLV